MIFYQKYRPQSLTDLVGQANVKSVLQSAFADGHLSHAYLFCGPRGTGKTSTARILAKMINCENSVKAPCNECDTCIAITNGSNLDLIEIDAASNRGIDDIRSLRENIKLAPTHSAKKIYIIDEVHMLSNEAFNALLKTLEEPPAHVVFILATTEEHKIPVTILSRVQKLDFQLGSVKDLMTSLQRVVDGEKLDIEEDALRAIAKRAEGSFRDGTKILDQLASRGEKITIDLVDQVLNSGSFNQLLEMIQALQQRDTQVALAQISSLNDRGLNLKDYVLSLTELVRYLFLLKYGSIDYVKDNLGPSRFKQVSEMADKFQPAQLLEIIKHLQGALEKMKTTAMPVLALEVAVVQCCNGDVVETPPKVVEKLIVATPGDADRGPSDEGAGPRATPAAKARTDEGIPARQDPLTEKVKADSEPKVETKSTSDYESMALLQDKWTYLLETVRSMNYSLEALLKVVKLSTCEDNIITFEVPYAFHQRIIESPKNRELVESVLSDILTKPARLATILGERPIEEEEIANIELAADDEIIRVAAEIFSAEPLQIADAPVS